ncbi:MAG: FAD-linked oxidase C-terminal domain-containing protein [Thermodesulfobacteriota bacterium]|nr:FAD-linked oxidase C-terminal domain-containing protein [Thermodesulfobacteriota bacterium]
MLKRNIVNTIKKIVGKENVYCELEERICYSYDATNERYLPDLVVFPANAHEISEILKIANHKSFPVIPRGAGSGFSGGTLPIKGGLVLCMARFNRVLSIDSENLIAFVEPGVVTGHFQKKVEKQGLFYPPDPASLSFSTIGGNVAECAGGPKAVKYGVTKDYVIGLEVVLPTSEIISTGVQTVKGVVGYDLTKLIVGSEGTLGIITRVIVKLLPKPESSKTIMGIYPKLDDAAKTVSDIIASKIIPSALEFMDQNAIVCVEDFLRIGLPVDAEAILLIEVDGNCETVNRDASKIKQICFANKADRAEIAGDTQSKENLWRARRAISPSLFKISSSKINEDITVPRSKIPDILKTINGIAKRYNLKIVNFGHAGDGNIHVNIMIDKKNEKESDLAKKAVKEIFQATLDIGGTLSGEHGIGTTKVPYLNMELGNLEVQVMKKIKKVFDPNNILNPGKVFQDSL